MIDVIIHFQDCSIRVMRSTIFIRYLNNMDPS